MGDSPDGSPITTVRAFRAPLRIGVIADTHIYPGSRRILPEGVLDLFARFDVGLILHAGDVNTVSVLESLAVIAPLIAVTGNNDDASVREIASEDVTFTAGPHTIGLIHGQGGASARAVATERFAGKVDLAVYGHSHLPKMERVDRTILFNPGSATDRRWSEHFGIGVINVSDVRIVPELILYKDPRELVAIKPD